MVYIPKPSNYISNIIKPIGYWVRETRFNVDVIIPAPGKVSPAFRDRARLLQATLFSRLFVSVFTKTRGYKLLESTNKTLACNDRMHLHTLNY